MPRGKLSDVNPAGTATTGTNTRTLFKCITKDQDFYENSGYLLFIDKHDVWPRTLEIQGRTNMEMTINAMDSHATFTVDKDMRKRVRKPAGQWNAVEIVTKGNEAWNYLNGYLISHVSQLDF